MKEHLKAHQMEFLALLVLALILLFYETVIVGNTKEKIEEIKNEIKKQEADLPKIEKLGSMSKDIVKLLDEIKEKPLQGATLASAIERIKDSLNLGGKVQKLKGNSPAPVDEDISIEEVEFAVVQMTLGDLVALLQAIENLGPSVRVKSLSIRKQGDRALLDMKISAFRFKS